MDDYNGIKLTPSIFKKIMIDNLDGKQFSRQQAIDVVKEEFAKNGGNIEGLNFIALFKAATRNLKDNGIENIGYGIWRLQFKEKEIEILDRQDEKFDVNNVADKTIGEGDAYIYVYYFDIYKKYAELNNKDIWQCKVGKTDREVLGRIISQSGTSYPEKPHIALIIKCESSGKLEKALHSILKFKNRWIEEAPGNEWFMTNEKEIEEIYNSII